MIDRPRILLTHTPDMRRNYYGKRALAGLQAVAGGAARGPRALAAGAHCRDARRHIIVATGPRRAGGAV
jgi:hypothetical protein